METIFMQRFCPTYSATKSAVIGFTRSLDGLAATDSIRVNCICPTYTETPFLQTAGLQEHEVSTQFEAAFAKLHQVCGREVGNT